MRLAKPAGMAILFSACSIPALGAILSECISPSENLAIGLILSEAMLCVAMFVTGLCLVLAEVDA